MNALRDAAGPLWPYFVVIVVGFLPSEFWRMLGVVISRGLRDDSEILVWVRYVAAAILAGVVAKLIVTPSGALATTPLLWRIGGLALAVAVFYAARRSVLAGVLAGVAVIVGASWTAS